MSPECARLLTGIAEEKDNATGTAAPASTPRCPVCGGDFETCRCT